MEQDLFTLRKMKNGEWEQLDSSLSCAAIIEIAMNVMDAARTFTPSEQMQARRELSTYGRHTHGGIIYDINIERIMETANAI